MATTGMTSINTISRLIRGRRSVAMECGRSHGIVPLRPSSKTECTYSEGTTVPDNWTTSTTSISKLRHGNWSIFPGCSYRHRETLTFCLHMATPSTSSEAVPVILAVTFTNSKSTRIYGALSNRKLSWALIKVLPWASKLSTKTDHTRHLQADSVTLAKWWKTAFTSLVGMMASKDSMTFTTMSFRNKEIQNFRSQRSIAIWNLG